MEQFEIKITGSGTPNEICKALADVISHIQQDKNKGTLDGAEWEDSTLMTEINAK